MTTNERFDDRLALWLREEARHRLPVHLDEVLLRTAATRQRSRWSSLEGWLPMSTTMPGRWTVAPALLWLLLATGLTATILGAAIASGALRLPSTPAFGLATNGRLVVADGTTLRSYAADGTDPRVLATLPAAVGAPTISPDGRYAATIMDAIGRLDVVDVVDGTTTTIPLDASIQGIAGPVTWSPDSSRILFNAFDGEVERLMTARFDGTDVRDVHLDTGGVAGPLARADETHIELGPVGWSPTGDHIAFMAAAPGGERALYVAESDGADVQRLDVADVERHSVAWSPDPMVARLAFAAATSEGFEVRVLDLASGRISTVGPGFWVTWSPDGSRLAYFHNGTVVVDIAAALAGTAEPLRVTPAFTTDCAQHPELADRSFCGPALWSPDGTRLYAIDVTGRSVLSVKADGTGDPIVIRLDTPRAVTEFIGGWQPIRP